MLELQYSMEMTTMNRAPRVLGKTLAGDGLPPELVDLLDRVRALPARLRSQLEPVVNDALEQARFRGRVLSVARDALEQLRLDLELARFDLDATRREREDLRRKLGQE
jgi:hypothetical protein